MSLPSARYYDREIEVGEHVSITQGKYAMPRLVGQTGIVVEVFRLPWESCLVRLDSDHNLQREWFFYRDEITLTRR